MAPSPVTERDWADAHLTNAAFEIHHDDPAFGYRFIADELAERGIRAEREPGVAAVLAAADLVGVREEGAASHASRARPSTTTSSSATSPRRRRTRSG